MYAPHRKPTTARIATAFVCLALFVAMPTAGAVPDEPPKMEEDGSLGWGTCFGLNPWTVPPGVYIDVLACIGM